MRTTILLLLLTTMFGCASKKPYQLVWETSALDGSFSNKRASLNAATPVLDEIAGEPTLFLGSRDGGLIAMKLKNRQPIWRWQHTGIFESPGTVVGPYLYIGDLEGHVHALEKATGKLIWSYQDEYEILGTPVVTDQLVLVANGGNVIVALSRQDGSLQWRYREDPPASVTIRGVSSPLLLGNQVIVGFSKGVLVGLELATGRMIWRQQVANDGHYMDVDATPVLVGDRILAAAVSGPLAAYSSDGKLLWTEEKIRSQVAVVAVPEKGGGVATDLLAVTLNGKVMRLHAQDGGKVWETEYETNSAAAPTAPIVLGDQMLFATSTGHIHVLNVSSGAATWDYQIGERVIGDLTSLTDGFIAMNGEQQLFRFRASKARR